MSLAAINFNHKINNSENSKPSSQILKFEEINFTKYANNGRDKEFTIHGKTLNPAAKKISLFAIGPVKTAEIRDVEVIFYEKNVRVSSMRSKKAVIDVPYGHGVKDAEVAALAAGRIDLSGNVMIMTENRRALVCDNLRWDSAKSRLFARGNCILGYDGRSVKADMVDTDVNLKDFELGNDRLKRLRAFTRIL
ncbi:MAG: hypothetical protein WC592_00635 [Candidatus Omnitrophota bacterium]